MLQQLLQKEGKKAVRMAVKGGGCSGLTYHLLFDENPPKTTDKVFETNGMTLVVDMKSYIYLNQTILDYASDLMGSGFRFNNPNAKKSCGCGVSFTA